LYTHLPEEILVELGRLTVTYSELEHMLKQLAGFLVSREDQQLGQIVTAQLSFRALMDIVPSLALHRFDDPTRLTKLGEILADADGVAARRNSIVHSDWAPGAFADTGLRLKQTARAKKGLHLHIEHVTAKDVRKVAADAAARAAEVTKIWCGT
jgi:hypothetical protein